jgi:transposase
VTGIVDLDRHRLIDVVENRTAQGVSAWLDAKPDRWLAGISVVTVDPYQGYANAVRASLAHADLVVDHFHAVRLANAALDDVRRRVQQSTLGRRGHRDDPLYRIRRRLLMAHERLPDNGQQRLLDALAVGDPDGEVAAAYRQELLREVYDTTSVGIARQRLEVFYRHCRQAEIIELARLARTIRRWEHEILGWHRTGMSNGPTEAMNLLIKRVKRVGHGFRNFANYRLRLLLHCGVQWQTPPTARIRGRQPRLVA